MIYKIKVMTDNKLKISNEIKTKNIKFVKCNLSTYSTMEKDENTLYFVKIGTGSEIRYKIYLGEYPVTNE